MPKYVPYVTAVQWLGSNITEVRQIVNASGGAITTVTVNPANQELSMHYSVEAVAANPTLYRSIVVPVNNWVIADGGTVFAVSPTFFTSRYTNVL